MLYAYISTCTYTHTQKNLLQNFLLKSLPAKKTLELPQVIGFNISVALLIPLCLIIWNWRHISSTPLSLTSLASSLGASGDTFKTFAFIIVLHIKWDTSCNAETLQWFVSAKIFTKSYGDETEVTWVLLCHNSLIPEVPNGVLLLRIQQISGFLWVVLLMKLLTWVYVSLYFHSSRFISMKRDQVFVQNYGL